MESYMKSTNTKRFVIQDTFTKVTSDGEPHEMMTMIACLSGLLAAIVILAILVSLVGCKKRRSRITKSEPTSIHSMHGNTTDAYCSRPQSNVDLDSKRSSMLSILRRGSSLVEDTQLDSLAQVRPRLVSVSCISHGNLEGNLNAAFINSELNLKGIGGGDGGKEKQHLKAKRTESGAAKETIIDMERY